MDAARSRSEESIVQCYGYVCVYIVTYFVNRDHNGHVTLLINLQSNHQSVIPSLSVLSLWSQRLS